MIQSLAYDLSMQLLLALLDVVVHYASDGWHWVATAATEREIVSSLIKASTVLICRVTLDVAYPGGRGR